MSDAGDLLDADGAAAGDDLAAGATRVGRVALQQMRSDLHNLLSQQTRGMGDRAAGHDDAARGDRSHPEWRQRGVAVAHGDFRGIDAELLVRDLGERGLQDVSVRVNPYRKDGRGVRRSVSGAAL